jgi:hypothetical protein
VCPLLPFTTVSFYMILALDISSFTLILWLRQRIFRYCMIYQERQRLSVTQDPICTARFVSLCTSAKPKLKECQNLYALSELAQHIIKDMAKRHPWTLQSFPTKVTLPTGILCPLPNAEATNKVLSCNASHFDDLIYRTMFNTDPEASVPPLGGIGLAKQSDEVSKS